MIFQPQAAHQVLALLCVRGVFVCGAGNPSFGLRHLVHHAAHGADEGLHVLDGYHAANEAEHRRHLRRALVAHGRKAGELDAVGDVERARRVSTVLYLAQAVGFIQRDDRVGRRIAVAPHPFKQPDPHLPEVRQLGRVALEDVAVVANPLALEQIDLPFLGVNAVLRQGKRYVTRIVQNSAQKACIACGRAVQHPHRDQVLRHAGQRPQGLEHDAHRPEIIHERGVGAVLAIGVADQFPGALAVQKIFQRKVAAGRHLAGHSAQHLQGLLGARAAFAQGVHDAAQHLERGFITRAGVRQVLCCQTVVQKVLFKVHHVGWQLVFELAVVRALAAQKHQRKAVFGEGLDDLVDPAGNAPAHIGKGAFQQQGNVSLGGFGVHHRALQ